MSTRQVVRVFAHNAPNTVSGEVPLPTVFTAPVRADLVHSVFTSLSKNNRQAYAVSRQAGKMATAESYGPGRAIARVPRVGGSGTGRSGQGAYANSCRGGRMFNPNVTWRRWHRKVNVNQKRHAVASAVAATGVPSLLVARGHRVNQLPEVPLVVDTLTASKTASLISILNSFGLSEELAKVSNSRKIRTGKGKARNRRYVNRKGPLIVYSDDSINVVKAAANIKGVEVCHISRLNLLQLAPGGHVGRLCIWTKGAFETLDKLFGNGESTAELKKGYVLQRPIMQCANLGRIINSDEIQNVIRPQVHTTVLHDRQKRNPLTNKSIMHKLNPFEAERKRLETEQQKKNTTNRQARAQERRKTRQAHHKAGRKFLANTLEMVKKANEETMDAYRKYIDATKIGAADESESEEESS